MVERRSPKPDDAGSNPAEPASPGSSSVESVPLIRERRVVRLHGGVLT